MEYTHLLIPQHAINPKELTEEFVSLEEKSSSWILEESLPSSLRRERILGKIEIIAEGKPINLNPEHVEGLCVTHLMNNNWSHLSTIPIRPNPTYFWNEVDSMMEGYQLFTKLFL